MRSVRPFTFVKRPLVSFCVTQIFHRKSRNGGQPATLNHETEVLPHPAAASRRPPSPNRRLRRLRGGYAWARLRSVLGVLRKTLHCTSEVQHEIPPILGGLRENFALYPRGTMRFRTNTRTNEVAHRTSTNVRSSDSRDSGRGNPAVDGTSNPDARALRVSS